jgi:hypothetical protein
MRSVDSNELLIKPPAIPETMKLSVLALRRKHFEVVPGVVPLIAVVVVHYFSRQQRSAEEFFSHDAMQVPTVKLHVGLAFTPSP